MKHFVKIRKLWKKSERIRKLCGKNGIFLNKLQYFGKFWDKSETHFLAV